jgi:hypothetical protein
MLWSLPGTDTKIRVFEEVKTVEDNYHIYDCGLQYAEGQIDSLAFGGSFHTIKNLCGSLDEKKAQQEEAVKTAAVISDTLADAVALVKKLSADKETADANVEAANKAEVATEESPTPELQAA